jgi:hypothetical protein
LKAGAAVFFDEGERRVDRARVDRAKNGSAPPLLPYKPGGHEATKVEGKRRRRNFEPRLQFPNSHAFTTSPHEQADDLKPSGVPKLGEAPGGNFDVHVALV